MKGAVRPAAVLLLRTGLGVALLPLLAGASFAAPAPTPSLRFAEPHAGLGEVFQHATVEHRYAVVNEGPAPVAILRVEPRAEEGWGLAQPALLPPGGRGEVVVYQPVGERLGLTSFRIRVTTDDPASPVYRLSLEGFVQSAYEPEAPRLELGTIDRDAGKTLELDVLSRQVDRLAVAAISGVGESLEVREVGRTGDAGEGIKLRATLRPGAPLGLHSGTFTLRTNVPEQPELRVQWRANVFTDVVPSANPVELGLARIGEPLAAEVVLHGRDGAALAVERVEDPSGRVAATVLPCAGAEDPSCRLVRLRHVPKERGAVDGDLKVFLAGHAEPLPLRYTGWAVAAGADIRNVDLADDLEDRRAWERSTAPPAAVPATPAPQPASGPAATLRWQAAREDEVYGYLVLRAEDRLGPFRRINPEVVRVPADDLGAGAHGYVYVDRDVVPGKTYYYYLDSVTRGGLKRRFSGVLTKTVPAR